MTIREQALEREAVLLAPYATFSNDSTGRLRPEIQCPIRTCFARDRDRILHSNAFRRLKHKTQVFIAPEGDHFRERMTHTLEVTQIARTIARALRLNEDLTEAIALGHDLGHTPFGHTGERVLDELCAGGFRHNEQSLRVVDKLEDGGAGLNLSHEVRDGIVNHRTSLSPATPEGQIVRLSDKIAYVNHDIQDALRCGALREDQLPKAPLERLGSSSARRIDALVVNAIQNSVGGVIALSADAQEALNTLRAFLFDNLYFSNDNMARADKAAGLLRILFAHYLDNAGTMPPSFEAQAQEQGRELTVCDYIAGMSDQYAIRCFEELFIPR